MPIGPGVYNPAYFRAYGNPYQDPYSDASNVDITSVAADTSGVSMTDYTDPNSTLFVQPVSGPPAAALDNSQGASVLEVPPSMPQATIQNTPNIVAQANAAAANNGQVPNSQVFGPTSILNPLPQIVAGPKATPGPTCNPVTQWVNENPFLAALLLGAGFLWATSKKG